MLRIVESDESPRYGLAMRLQRRGGSKQHEREMRRAPTDAEAVLWGVLRERGLNHWRFRRQHRIDYFILDFYCPRLRLGIELDGDPHFTEIGRNVDAYREEVLATRGISVIRFENREVLANTFLISQAIARRCEERAAELRVNGAPQLQN